MSLSQTIQAIIAEEENRRLGLREKKRARKMGERGMLSTVGSTLAQPLGSALADAFSSSSIGEATAATTAGTTAGSTAGVPGVGLSGSVGSVALPLAAAIAGARGYHEAYDEWKNPVGDKKTAIGMGGEPVFAGINEMLGTPLNQKDVSRIGLWINPITAPVAILDATLKPFGISIFDKPHDSDYREGVRTDSKLNTLYDGNNIKFGDVNIDTGALGYKPVKNKDGTISYQKVDGHSYNVDLEKAENDKEYAKLIAEVDPLIRLSLSGVYDNPEQFVAEAVNAIDLSGVDSKEAVRALYQEQGQSRASMMMGIDKLYEEGEIDKQTRDIYKESVRAVFDDKDEKEARN